MVDLTLLKYQHLLQSKKNEPLTNHVRRLSPLSDGRDLDRATSKGELFFFFVNLNQRKIVRTV